VEQFSRWKQGDLMQKTRELINWSSKRWRKSTKNF